jgi:L-asparaginase
MKLPRVLILYTGGTLGMEIQPTSPSQTLELALPKLSAPSLKRRFQQSIPELTQLAQCDVEVLLNRDSSHIGPEEWILFAKKIQDQWDSYDGIVLLHGTDTLAYTASALSFLLRPCLKPVILTGAQRPLSALRNDARTNLISAVEIAAHGPRKVVNQVTVFFGGQLFQGNRVRKRSAADFAAFESPQFPPLAVVGTTTRYTKVSAPSRSATPLKPVFSRKVLMIHVTPSFPSEALSEHLLPHLEGLVLIIFPALTAPTHETEFLKFLKTAQKRGIPLILTSESTCQPPGSSTPQINYEASKKLLSLGALSAGAMTPECAYVKTLLTLGQLREKSRNLSGFARLWKKEFAGEGSS